MHKQECPSHIRIVFQALYDVVHLFFGNRIIIIVIAIHSDKKHVFINEMVISSPVTFLPLILHYQVCDIMITREVKKWWFQITQYLVELVPFISNLDCILSISLNEIPNTHYKLRHEQIYFINSIRKYPFPAPACIIAYNCKLKVHGIIIEVKVCPRFFFCLNICFKNFILRAD